MARVCIYDRFGQWSLLFAVCTLLFSWLRSFLILRALMTTESASSVPSNAASETDAKSSTQTSRLTEVRSFSDRGRAQIASCDIVKDSVVFQAVPYAACVFKNFRKRVCANCLRYHAEGRYSLHCSDCRQAFFCSDACQTAYSAKQHRLICPALRKLSGSKDKFDVTLRSILHLVMCVLHARWLERNPQSEPAQTSASNSKQSAASIAVDSIAEQSDTKSSTFAQNSESSAARPNFADLTNLVHHVDKWQPQAFSYYLAAIKFLYQHLPAELLKRDSEPPGTFSGNGNASVSASTSSATPLATAATTTSPTSIAESKQSKSHAKRSTPRQTGKGHHAQSALALARMPVTVSSASASGASSKSAQATRACICANSPTPVTRLCEFELYALISRIESNCFGLYGPKSDECIGRGEKSCLLWRFHRALCAGLFPLASFFNHSCVPNCVCVQNGEVMSVVTNAAVRKGVRSSCSRALVYSRAFV